MNEIGWRFDASKEVVEHVFASPINAWDDPTFPNQGRSPWVWIRLANGDLLLGCFPQADTYMEIEQAVEYDWHRSDNNRAPLIHDDRP